MKAEYLNPLMIATKDVFQSMLQLAIEAGEVSTNEDHVATQGVNVSIGVTGDLRGVIVYSFPEEMALAIVTHMAGMEMKTMDKFVTSAMGELANIISGQAMTHFTEEKYQCDIVPPQIFIGENMTLSMGKEEIHTTRLRSAMGDFSIHLALEPGKSMGSDL